MKKVLFVFAAALAMVACGTKEAQTEENAEAAVQEVVVEEAEDATLVDTIAAAVEAVEDAVEAGKDVVDAIAK